MCETHTHTGIVTNIWAKSHRTGRRQRGLPGAGLADPALADSILKMPVLMGTLIRSQGPGKWALSRAVDQTRSYWAEHWSEQVPDAQAMFPLARLPICWVQCR
jgi:hypothetical protein